MSSLVDKATHEFILHLTFTPLCSSCSAAVENSQPCSASAPPLPPQHVVHTLHYNSTLLHVSEPHLPDISLDPSPGFDALSQTRLAKRSSRLHVDFWGILPRSPQRGVARIGVKARETHSQGLRAAASLSLSTPLILTWLVTMQVIEAIRTQKNPKGSSLQAVKKYLKAEHDFENPTQLKKALKKALDDKKIENITKSSYGVPGEVYAPPADETVQISNDEEGSGAAAASGDTVTMSYKGTLEDGSEFDAADTFKFCIDEGTVIRGWDQGIKGMKVGGSRTLSIPPKLGYGKKGSLPEIPPNATLIFDVKLKKIA